MTAPAVRRYMMIETIISVVINSAISAGFAWFVFGGAPLAKVWTPGGVAFDFVPQTFMISLMSVLVPTALTRKRVRAGTIERSPADSRLPSNIFLRALLIAVSATVVLGGMGVALLAVLGINTIPFGMLFPAKIAYGAAVSLIVTPIALRAALAD